jgi:hypothetical protein
MRGPASKREGIHAAAGAAPAAVPMTAAATVPTMAVAAAGTAVAADHPQDLTTIPPFPHYALSPPPLSLY